MLRTILSQCRFFTTSKDTVKLTQHARKNKKEIGQTRKVDLLRTVLPNEQQKFAFDKRPIPQGYRQFIEDVVHLANDEVKAAHSLENATPGEVKRARKMELVKKWGNNEKDTGNPAVQVGAMTEQIMFLANHVRLNNLDTLAYLNLRKALDKRRKMMQYLARYDYHLYVEVCEYLGINQLNYPQHKEVKNIKIKKS